MAVMIKCKMCGGDLVLVDGKSVAECEYCGSLQTVPSADSEKKLTLFARANRLRSACEFDKAAGIYEAIVADFPQEAEAYWGLVLCKYGIEYVDDPATGKKIPTCHRSSFDSVLEDTNYDQALENADSPARRVYREEAKQLEEIRTGIIAVSANEEPYDIFICYKETDENGNRTLDSVLAQDVYDALTEKGYRTFFSRITLEDKLGVEYEPYIFAALNSAKIMLVVGTDFEYFNAVWVKNEWSRFLKLMTTDKAKHLIPCFKGIDAYDMPREFAKLQAQDLGKVGATQDLLRGIEKILPKKQAVVHTVQTIQSTDGNTVSLDVLLARAHEYLQKGDWYRATQFADKTLDFNSGNAEAHLVRLMSKLNIRSKDEFDKVTADFRNDLNYKQYLRYCTPNRKAELEKYASEAALRFHYKEALTLGESTDVRKVEQGIRILSEMLDWQDSRKQHQRLTERKNQLIYDKAWTLQNRSNPESWEEAILLYTSIEGWKDAAVQKQKCREKLQHIVYRNAMELKDKPMLEQDWNYTDSPIYKETGKYPWELKVDEYDQAKELFDTIADYKDAKQQSQNCLTLSNDLILENAKIGMDSDMESSVLENWRNSDKLLTDAKDTLRKLFMKNIQDLHRARKLISLDLFRFIGMLALMAVGFFMTVKYDSAMDLIPMLSDHPGWTQALGAALLLTPFHFLFTEFVCEILDFLDFFCGSYRSVGNHYISTLSLRDSIVALPLLTVLLAALWGILNTLTSIIWGFFGLVHLITKILNFVLIVAAVISLIVCVVRFFTNKGQVKKLNKKTQLYQLAIQHLNNNELDKLEPFCHLAHAADDDLDELLGQKMA